jgi:tetratricopeptide (TPR) repeat protein
MDTVTYPDRRVADYIKQHFVPFKVNVREKPDVAAAFDVVWTPNVVVADEAGKVHYRIEGYLPPEDFIAQLALGLGRYQFDRSQFAGAIHHFEEVTKRHAGTDAAAQALYWLGVASYKKSNDPGQLRPSWERLVKEYPKSEWAKKANVPAKG